MADTLHSATSITGGHTNAVASGAAGFMSGADKAKLDGITGTPAPTTRNLTAGAGLTGGGDLSADRTFDVAANADGSIVVNANDVQVGVLATDGQHGARGGGTQHANAVAAGAAGFMTGSDKSKLDGVESGAQVCSEANVRTALAALTADPNVNARKLTNLAEPSATTDAATKNYVDNATGTVGGVAGAIVANAMLAALFGDGSDGAFPGGVVTLSRDTFYSTWTWASGHQILTNGFNLYFSSTVDLSNAPADTITRTGPVGGNGNAGGAGGTATAGTNVIGATCGGGRASIVGGAGGTGAGTQAGALTISEGVVGGLGGTSSAGGSGNGGANAGGASRAGGTATAGYGGGNRGFLDPVGFSGLTTAGVMTMGLAGGGTPGGSGGGGGGDGTAGGGGASGGGPGGVMRVRIRTLTTNGSTAAGVISSKGGVGGTGGTPAAGNRGGGGAGGGGGGGMIDLVVGTRSGATVANGIDASGGTGGTGGTGTGTGLGAAGGSGGSGGLIAYTVLATSPTPTRVAAGTAGSAGGAASGVTGGSGGAGGASRATL